MIMIIHTVTDRQADSHDYTCITALSRAAVTIGDGCEEIRIMALF